MMCKVISSRQNCDTLANTSPASKIPKAQQNILDDPVGRRTAQLTKVGLATVAPLAKSHPS